jgi:PD-(D/E)XK nuclease family transposase
MTTDKYINPFTDFGFKKLFGTEPNKDLLIDFDTAEIAKFSPDEKSQYEESLKIYRDLKNVIDTSFGEGKLEGKIEGIINSLKRGKLTIEEIAEDFNTTVDFVLKIKKEYNI